MRASHGTAVLASALILAPAAAGVGAAADPFYESLLLRGTDALHRGDYARAEKHLRLAVFGLLEEPELLARGLALLAVAQAGSDHLGAFRETFLRVMEIEDRFQSYSRAELSPQSREEFERLAVRHVPPRTLTTSATFARVLERHHERRLAALSPRERRRELERLGRDEPDVPRWSLMLARMSLEEDELEEAIRHASRVLDTRPGHDEARLLRGLAQAESGRWGAAVQDLEASALVAHDPRGAKALLEAYVAQEEWTRAKRFLAELPDEIRTSPEITAVARRIGVSRASPGG